MEDFTKALEGVLFAGLKRIDNLTEEELKQAFDEPEDNTATLEGAWK